MDFEQAIQQLQQAKDDPQALALTTARITCSRIHPELFEILQTAAIPHWFDDSILANLLKTDKETAKTWLNRLKKLPMVEKFTMREAWNVHETTRSALLEELAHNDSTRYKQLTTLAADRFVGKEGYQRIEQIYHHLQTDRAEAAAQLNKLYLEWNRTGNYEAHQTLALALEELIQKNLLQGVAMARSLVVLGWIKGSRISTCNAKSMAELAISLFKNEEDEFGEVDARQWLGLLLQKDGNLSEALYEFQTCITIMRRLTKQFPDNIDWLRELSISHHNIGQIHQSQGNLADALQEFVTFQNIMRQLCEQDTDNTEWQRDLAISYNNIGRVLQTQGKLITALQEFQKGHKIRERLCELAPDNFYNLHDLSVSHSDIGRVLQSKGNLDEALREFNAYHDIIKHLSELDPGNSDWLRELSVSHNKIGRIQRSLGNMKEALREFKTELEIIYQLCEYDPDNSNWLHELSITHIEIGRVKLSQGKQSEALQEFRTTQHIMQQLCNRDPDNSDWQRDLSVSHFFMASILEAEQKFEEALLERKADLAISERLARMEPSNQQWQEDLEASRQAIENLKHLMSQSGDD